MKLKVSQRDETIVRENKTLKTILSFIGIIFLIGITVAATLLFLNRKTVAIKLAQLLVGGKIQEETKETQPADQIVTTKTKTNPEMDAYKNRSVQYYNCKHGYTFYYPQEWSNNAMTSDSDVVELYGTNLTGRITAMYNGAPLTDKTLYSLANDKLKSAKGIQIGTRDKDRNGVHILAYDFKDPRSLFVLWQSGNYQIEMRFFGSWNQQEEDNVGYLLATFNPGDVNDPNCQNTTSTTTHQQKTIQSQTVQPQGCSHPNGDVQMWWNDVSQDVRDCYISKYGWPAFALPDSNQGDAGVADQPCSFPNGDVEYWWNSVSQATRDCFTSQGGIAPR